MNVYLDFETRSRADLPKVGAYRYGSDPSTEVLMAAVSAEGEDSPVYLWVNSKYETEGMKSEPEALRLLAQADSVYAHNAPFEHAIVWGTGCCNIRLEQWRCTAAMARMAGLPDSLSKCSIALGLPELKDAKGKSLIRLFSIPDVETGEFNSPHEYVEKWKQFGQYCRQDVTVEKAIHKQLSKSFSLEGNNLSDFLFTLRMNTVGIPVNCEALDAADLMVDQVSSRAVKEFRNLTGVNVTQRSKVLDWLKFNGVAILDMQASTLEAVVREDLDPVTKRGIQLYSQLSYAAIKKISTMRAWACSDQRMRGVFKYYGAGTGRWSAGGPQIQNAKKATYAMRSLTGPAYDYLCNGGTSEGIEAVYGDCLEVLASSIRHFIHADYPLLDADYNAIEARIACWVSGEGQALIDYSRGVDRYRTMASKIYGVSESRVTPDQRALGKVAILGLGYGMGAEKFHASCRDLYGIKISMDMAEQAKSTFRSEHPRMTALWRKLESDIRSAIGSPRTIFESCSHLRLWTEWTAGMNYLIIRLPSGRKLAYPLPAIEDDGITYWGAVAASTQWGRVKMYGAKMFENICQAIAADVMAHGAINAESKGMMPFALIHDQGLAIQDRGQKPEDFAQALSKVPPWATGLPLRVEAKLVPYYSK
jgi:DNA polymerase bacteriophage-type